MSFSLFFGISPAIISPSGLETTISNLIYFSFHVKVKLRIKSLCNVRKSGEIDGFDLECGNEIDYESPYYSDLS